MRSYLVIMLVVWCAGLTPPATAQGAADGGDRRLALTVAVLDPQVVTCGPVWLQVTLRNNGPDEIELKDFWLGAGLEMAMTDPDGRKAKITSIRFDGVDLMTSFSIYPPMKVKAGGVASYRLSFAAAKLGEAKDWSFVFPKPGRYAVEAQLRDGSMPRRLLAAAVPSVVECKEPQAIVPLLRRLRRLKHSATICARVDGLNAEAKTEAARLIKDLPGTVWAEMAQITLARIAIVENPETVSLEQLLGYLNTFWKGHRAAVHQLIGLWRGTQAAGQVNGRRRVIEAYIEQIAPDFGDTEEIIHLRDLP